MASDNTFDRSASTYAEELHKGVGLSGERSDYFAEARVAWLARRLETVDPVVNISRVMDFGCGIGGSFGYLKEAFGLSHLVGIDTSTESLDIAEAQARDLDVAFAGYSRAEDGSEVDLAFSNGTFHHILPEERAGCIQDIYRCLRPGGYVAVWENYPRRNA